jgi:hypothetical protein
MDLSALADLLANAGILAKDIGKGGGGSTEEPTLCLSLLPVALGVLLVAIERVRGRCPAASSGAPGRDRA